MSDVHYLDLDEAVPTVKKTVKIDGKEYTFKEPSIEDFAKDMARMKDVKRRSNEIAEEEGLGDQERDLKQTELMLTVMLDGIRQAFPDMPEEVIKGLSTPRITAIRNFIQEEVTKDAEDEAGNA